MTQKTVIIDYGLGNLRSVQKAILRIGLNAEVSGEWSVIQSADRLILPGVGHFAQGMRNLRNLNLVDILSEKVMVGKVPILGICLGMQLMTKFSEEGNCDGLSWIDATTKLFLKNEQNPSLKVPHMGWNTLFVNKDTPLTQDIQQDSFFYFVHSYFVECANRDDVLTTTKYGLDFVSSFQRENIYGLQFHPEKSHFQGLEMLKNFIKEV